MKSLQGALNAPKIKALQISLEPGLMNTSSTPVAEPFSQAAIERRLHELGYRMECSLASLDDEGHAVIEIASGECVDPPDGEVLTLALAWSEIEGLGASTE